MIAAMEHLPYELYRAEQVRELDRIAIEEGGILGVQLMERAGQAAFAALRARWPQAQRIAVLAGVGNNGGDAYVVARLAYQAGLQVALFQVGEHSRLTGDALRKAQQAQQEGVPLRSFSGVLEDEWDLLVDGVLGTGIEGEVRGAAAAAVTAINASPAAVLALDIPSGLNSDSGLIMGRAVRATCTVTFIALKRGMCTADGPDYCGQLMFDDLQVPADFYAAVGEPAQRLVVERLPQLPVRRSNCHKGDFGHVLVIGGDYGMSGAARMAAEAAARCGAGMVSVATRPEHAATMAAARPELMCHGVDGAAALSPLLERATVVVVGPGLGCSAWGKELLQQAMVSQLPLLVDADGLQLLAGEKQRRDNWVLTPHPGEAAQLLGVTSGAIQAERFSAVEGIVERFGGCCVLKGNGTLVRSEGGSTGVCCHGTPGMATAGMGDVLSGVIAALVAQGMSLAAAARLGVCLHAVAAERAAADGLRGMLASDLFPHLRTLLG